MDFQERIRYDIAVPSKDEILRIAHELFIERKDQRNSMCMNTEAKAT
jgi:hypothetical protein